MFQNPGFIQTNKQANKLTNKLPRPMWIAVGSSKGNIVLGIEPQAQGRIPRPTPPGPGKPGSGTGGISPGPGPGSSRGVAKPSQRAPIAAGAEMCPSCIRSIKENVIV